MIPPLHPACAAFPPLPDIALVELAESIKRNGLRNAITLMPDGTILDGRCRWLGCEMANVTPRTVVFNGDDPISFVVDANKHRRHMSKSQLAMAVGILANLPAHRPSAKLTVETFDSYSTEELAKTAGIDASYVKDASVIHKNADPSFVAMVAAGSVNVRAAANVVRAKVPLDVQATMTADDVKQKSAEIILLRKRPAKKPEEVAPGQLSKAERDAVYERSLARSTETLVLPPKESLGIPAFSEDRNANSDHLLKYGRVQVNEKHVADLRAKVRPANDLLTMLSRLSSAEFPDADTFFAVIAEMMATPEPTHGKHEFPAKAKQMLELLAQRLPKVIERLRKFQTIRAVG